jgi:hypothetical protein
MQNSRKGWPKGKRGNFDKQLDGRIEDEEPGDNEEMSPDLARRLAQEAYDSSTDWLDSGRRAAWTDSLRAFQSLHPTASKYLSRDFMYRSALFRPKTRAMIRSDEAQTAAAFFSNEDVVSITPGDGDDPIQKASADLNQQLLQYRLTKTIPWFLTLLGARQDADVQGVCIANAGWRFEEVPTGEMATDINGEEIEVMKRVKDEPFIDLLAPENIRIEPGADWRDPINSSPYVIHLIPMYIEDVRDRIATGEWLPVSDNALRSSSDSDDDTTRSAREPKRVPGKDTTAWKPRAYTICWVRRNIMRWGGEDWNYYTLSSGELLSDPVRLIEVELHGMRPYVMGYVVLESHRTYPSGKIELVADLQRAANDDWNLRFDNLKLSLNPRQFVRAGSGYEQQDLTRFAPGKVIIANVGKDEPLANSVLWDRPPPPDAAAYAEQDRINYDWDQLSGSFGMESVQASSMREAPATGMNLLSGMSSGMNEYELRVFAETFVEPLLRLMVKLEQVYETDPVILGLAGKKAQLYQKYGLNQITDELLNQEITTKVNVGIGATNPALKLRNAMGMAAAIGQIFGPLAAQKLDFDETFAEFAALSGYKDGKRFLKDDAPSIQEMMLQQQIAQLTGKGSQGAPPDQSKVQAAQITSNARVQEQQLRMESDQRSDQMDLQRVMLAEQGENYRTQLQLNVEMQKMQADQAHQTAMAHAKMQAEAMKIQSGQMHQDATAERNHERQRQVDVPPDEAFAGLMDGRVRTFGNGQKWRTKQGKRERVS